ncbi:MAG: histidinol dehydrogenase [Pseudomonadota bacterium]
MVHRLDIGDADFAKNMRALVHTKREQDDAVHDAVREILQRVAQDGDAAIHAYTSQFDGVDLGVTGLRVGVQARDDAAQSCSQTLLHALAHAKDRIADYHHRMMPQDITYEDAQGVTLGALWRPVTRVGIYVPGGLAAYPSSVLMAAVPARVAGVKDIIMCVPTPDGTLVPEVFACAKLCGIEEIYSIGGAQAIAAMAYGSETIAKVDKIVGPGNAYVAAAKRQTYGQVGIDMIAGPSEILIISDTMQQPEHIAMDLLSQAEHDENAQSILICDDKDFAHKVERAVDHHLKTLPRAAIAGKSWQEYGAIIIVQDLWQEAAPLIDVLAPEHLMLAMENARDFVPKIHHAGAIFVGAHTPEAVGDYLAGPSHVLPTARSARFSSGLGVHDFLKRSSLIGCTAQSLKTLGSDVVHMARAEGLEAHARSVALRIESNENNKHDH